MINYNIRSENIEVTHAIRDYIEKRLNKIEKYFSHSDDIKAFVNLKFFKDKQSKVEVTIVLPRLTLRAEDINKDLYKSIDKVLDKLERQIHKYKTKINRQLRKKEIKLTEETEQEPLFDIVRAKNVTLDEMTREEAALRMTMLEHDFYLFKDSETGDISVIYLRLDGRYGIIIGK